MLWTPFHRLALAVILAGASSWGTLAAHAAQDSVTLGPDVKGQGWRPNAQTNPKERKYRETKGRKNPGSLSVTIEGRRGSVFVNGRFVGAAPVSDYLVPSGKNDIQIRDGSTVLAEGVLTVPSGKLVTMTVTPL